MTPMMLKIVEAKNCPNCAIVLVTTKYGSKFNDVRLCEESKAKVKKLVEELKEEEDFYEN